jgi:hypothetical protein
MAEGAHAIQVVKKQFNILVTNLKIRDSLDKIRRRWKYRKTDLNFTVIEYAGVHYCGFVFYCLIFKL